MISKSCKVSSLRSGLNDDWCTQGVVSVIYRPIYFSMILPAKIDLVHVQSMKRKKCHQI